MQNKHSLTTTQSIALTVGAISTNAMQAPFTHRFLTKGEVGVSMVNGTTMHLTSLMEMVMLRSC